MTDIDVHFDAVVMLTWSDWKTEPRSNRYHYASRFARTLPVLFLQHRYSTRSGIAVEPSELANVDIVNVNTGLLPRDVRDIKRLLDARGIRRPLLWIYDSLHYQPLIDALPSAFSVYHATEDYLTKTKGWNQGMETTAQSVVKLLTHVDFMVGCTPGVTNSYITAGGYRGKYVTIENGCDAEYFLEFQDQHAVQRASMPVAIFQGGINQRLDYELLLDLVIRMPDWEFRFCGASVDSVGWASVSSQSNVRYLGALAPEDFARQMCEATVGIIPYIQDQWIRNSLPLKAYEYIACGLPVVTVPISALERDKDLIAVATSSNEFEVAIRLAPSTRDDPAFLARRRQVALANSYNSRFDAMGESLIAAKKELSGVQKKLRVAVLYDCMRSTHVSTILEHLESFGKYSSNDITYLPATPEYWQRTAEEVLSLVDLTIFDVLIIHYSTRLSVAEHLDEGLARAVEGFLGLKVLFMQDEYEGTEIARTWMDRLQFDIVYTCVPVSGLEYVYPSYRFPKTAFLSTLTGYAPEDPDLPRHCRPLSSRKILIAYRGRKLPAVYGRLGYEKYRIGVEMKIISEMRRLPIDIEVDDSKRIYGAGWYEFLGSARATLGTESGANVFDLDGSLKREIRRLSAASPEITFEELSAKVLDGHEGRVVMNQISPKIFEAISLRTALVLFEGSYSNVVRANDHYIPLKKDFSNVDDVLMKIQDDHYLRALTDRAYEEIIKSGRFSYRHFISGVDADMQSRVLHSNSQVVLQGPILVMGQDGNLRQAIPAMALGLSVGAHPLGFPRSLAELSATFPSQTVAYVPPDPVATEGIAPEPAAAGSRLARWLWRGLPVELRQNTLRTARKILRQNRSVSPPKTFAFSLAKGGWHLLPMFARRRLARLIERN